MCFRAEWSAVCRAVDPILVDLAKEYADRLAAVRHDIGQHPLTPPKYQVTAIPTFHVFKSGSIVATRIGPSSKRDLLELITAHL